MVYAFDQLAYQGIHQVPSTSTVLSDVMASKYAAQLGKCWYGKLTPWYAWRRTEDERQDKVQRVHTCWSPKRHIPLVSLLLWHNINDCCTFIWPIYWVHGLFIDTVSLVIPGDHIAKGILIWSHHENKIIVDQTLAFFSDRYCWEVCNCRRWHSDRLKVSIRYRVLNTAWCFMTTAVNCLRVIA